MHSRNIKYLGYRIVVTNIQFKPQTVYKNYRGRVDAEYRTKELHHGWEIDRTSYTSFLTNQLRILLTAAAYAIMQEMRRCTAGAALAAAQLTTLREPLLKLSA